MRELEDMIPYINYLREQGFMHPTQFEMETAMAFSLLCAKKVRHCCGGGGRRGTDGLHEHCEDNGSGGADVYFSRSYGSAWSYHYGYYAG